nr:reverse transcriptase domain-containing protein [Tanacetum cinerariifolium]
MIQTWTPGKKRNSEILKNWAPSTKEQFPWVGFFPSSDLMVITAVLPGNIKKLIRPPTIILIGFSSKRSIPRGVIKLETTFGTHLLSRTVIIKFHVVKSHSKYNILCGWTAIQQVCAVESTIRRCMPFLTKEGLATVKSDCPGKDEELSRRG